MALPRLDYQAPDFAGRIGEGVDRAAKVAEGLSPAHPAVQKYLRAALNGEMDPQHAGLMAKLEAGGHLGPGAGLPPPTQLTGGQTTFTGPQPGAPMGKVNAPSASPPPAAQPGGQYSEDITISGRAPSSSSSDISLLGDNTSILNRDVPLLMQVAGQAQKHNPMDTYMKLYALGLRGQALQEKYREFEGMAPVRQSMINQRDAGITNMPFNNQMRAGTLAQTVRRNDIAAGNLALSQDTAYMRGTAGTAMPIAQIQNLLQQADTIPGITPGKDDYAARQAAKVASGLPLVGKAVGAGIGAIADYNLTPEQRAWRRDVQAMIAPYQHFLVGSQVTAGERENIDIILGQQTSFEDTKRALQSLLASMSADKARWDRLLPGAAKRAGQVDPRAVFPQQPGAYPTDIGGGVEAIQPGPEGPSLEDELNSPTNPLRRR